MPSLQVNASVLSIPSSNKYEGEGGPSLPQSFALLEQCPRPIIAKRAMLESIIYNYLIGNDDAHGKNFSLLHLKLIQEVAIKQIKQLPSILENILNSDRKDSEIGKQIYEQVKKNSEQLERILQE